MNSFSQFDWRRIVFSLIVLSYVGFLGFITMMMFLPGNWFSAMGHFGFFTTGETDDLIHELVFALIVGTAAMGLLSQLWKPQEYFAGQLVALVVWIMMIVTAALTGNWVPQPLFIIFGGLTFLATIFHPEGHGLFKWFSVAQVNRVLLVLVIIAAVPLLPFALTNINLQRESGGAAGLFNHQIPAMHGGNAVTESEPSQDQLSDEADHERMHGGLGHFRNFAALSLIILVAGFLAGLRPKGWRLAAWVSGSLPIILGLASVVFPNAESSLGLLWTLAAIAWGIHFIVMAECIQRGIRIHPGFIDQQPVQAA
jgi:hypothetical protein